MLHFLGTRDLLEDIAIGGEFTKDRLLKKIKNHRKMKPRLLEANRLRELADQTKSRLRPNVN